LSNWWIVFVQCSTRLSTAFGDREFG
jgi:hypothetical protein